MKKPKKDDTVGTGAGDLEFVAVKAARKLSYQEFLDFEGEDEALWYEWFEGELVVSPPPDRLHQLVTVRLADELRRLNDTAGHALTLPNILYRVSPTRARIVSPATAARDLREKRDEYRAAGVPVYWIVDVDVRSVTVRDFTVDPPRGTEHRGRLPWRLGGQLLGEINLGALFSTAGVLR